MADKTKHSNDEIFDLLSAMAVDIEEIKNKSDGNTLQAEDDEINPLKCFEKEVMWQRSLRDWHNYQKQKDEEWYDLMDNFAKQINNNMAIDMGHKQEIKKALILIKSLTENKNKEDNSMRNPDITTKAEPLIIPKNFKRWLKFLFYDCPKYSFSMPNRRKFLSDLGRIIRFLITVIIVVLVFLLANENHHFREKIAKIQRNEQNINCP